MFQIVASLHKKFQYIYLKNPHIHGPAQLKPTLLKGSPYSQLNYLTPRLNRHRQNLGVPESGVWRGEWWCWC